MIQSKRVARRSLWLRRTTLLTTGLIAFVALDMFLVALALGWGQDEPETAESSQTQSSTSYDDHSDLAGVRELSVEPSAERSAKPSDMSERVQAAPRLLSVVSETVAWRSEGGPCEQRGSLELTVDGGQTWGGAYPVAEGLGRPLWVSGADYTTVQSAIAAGADCDLEGVRTFDSGASWMQADQVISNSVHVDSTDPSVVVWGGESIHGPCEAMKQAAVTDGAVSVICSDGSVWTTSFSEGYEWSQSPVRSAVAVSGSEGRWISAVKSSDCDGLGLVEFDHASVESFACVPVDPAEATALDLAGDTLWIWTGNQVLISTDFGRSLNS